MKSENYIENAMTTASGDKDAILKRISEPAMIDILHAAMGMVTESAELMDMLKKHFFYGKTLDLINAEEELGDMNWYQSLMIHSMRMKDHFTTWEKIWEKNIDKLKFRYPEKFSEEAAIIRNLNEERKILEKE